MRKNELTKIIEPLAFLAGIALGILLPAYSDTYKTIGAVYVNLLKLLALPILMCMVFDAVVKAAQKSKLLPQVLVVFIVLFAATFLLTAVFAVLIRPGRNAILGGQIWDGQPTVFSAQTVINKIVPSNLFASMSAGDFLPCILIAAALGFAAKKTGAETLKTVVTDFEKVLLKLLEYVMHLTPIGVFFLMAAAASIGGGAIIGTGIKYILTAWVCCIIALACVMLTPVCLIKKISPWTYIIKVRNVILNSLSTCSSAATLPVTLDVCRREFDIDEDITGLAAPLGCTIHMCGGAVSFCLLAFFVFQMENKPVTLGIFLLMLAAAEIINMAAPGIPGGGIVIGASYLSLLGAPLTIMGLYSGIYRFLDMAYTTLNVLGDITANVILQYRRDRKTEKEDAQKKA